MIKTPEEYFNIEDTLSCGQVFRYEREGDGYRVYSGRECAVIKGDEIYSTDDGYFEKYFDLRTDYAAINRRMKSYNIDFLSAAAEKGKGIRLLCQDKEEMFISFIISQNNNIPRIKKIIGGLSEKLGEKREFMGKEYYAFPSLKSLSSESEDFYKQAGLGYRAGYIAAAAKRLMQEGAESYSVLSSEDLKKKLVSYKGVGSKVADCISLFAYKKTDSFPVDTWVEKLYREDLKGELKSREEINRYLTGLFKEDSGMAQQYMFYYKRGNRG